MEHVEGEEVKDGLGEIGEGDVVKGELGETVRGKLGEMVKGEQGDMGEGELVGGEVVLPFELDMEESQDLLSLTEELRHVLDPKVQCMCTRTSENQCNTSVVCHSDAKGKYLSPTVPHVYLYV